MDRIMNLSQEDITSIFQEMTLEELEQLSEKVNEMRALLDESLGVE